VPPEKTVQLQTGAYAGRAAGSLRLARIAGGTAMAMSLVVLVGWAFHLSVLTSLLPGLATMKPNTAAGFALAGLALLRGSASGGSVGSERAARTFGMAVAVLGAVSLTQDVTGRDFGVDRLLFRDAVSAVQTFHPGRMSPVTALLFILLGAGLALQRRGSRKAIPTQLLALTALLLASVAALGYLYGVSALYRVGIYSSIALHTVALFIVVSLGVLAAGPRGGVMKRFLSDGPGGEALRRVLPFAVLVPVAVGWLRLWGQRHGLYDLGFGVALFVTSTVVILSIVLWHNTGRIDEFDAEQRSTEERLRFAEKTSKLLERLEEVHRIAKIGDFERDLDTGNGFWSNELYAIFDLDPRGGIPSVEASIDLIHPEDRLKFRAAYQDAVEGSGRSALDYRVRTRKGTTRHVHAVLHLRHSGPGEPRTMVGIAMDVTAQREIEESLRQFFLLAQDLLAVASFEGYFLEINAAFASLVGWSREELCSRPWVEFIPEAERAQARKDAERLTRGGGDLNYESQFVCADGSKRWLRWSVTADLDRKVFYTAARDITLERSEREQLRHDVLHDPLTGLANRVHLLQTLERCLARAARTAAARVAVIYLDLDGFKPVNDDLGHAVGDELLFEVGLRLRDAVRPGDHIARLGGDEFAIVLDPVQPDERAERVAARILGRLAELFVLSKGQATVGASLGIALSMAGDDAAGLLAAADAAMYEAKRAGGRRFVVALRGGAGSAMGKAAPPEPAEAQAGRLRVGATWLESGDGEPDAVRRGR
jgi:diguanylate cyclase (GGDEF)-like protein/PAS domain S-box-containing protein